MKLKKGDEIRVVAGKDKGKSGKIEAVLTKENRVLVMGVNEYKKHQKGRMEGQKSEIITITKPLPVANVQMVCPKCKKLTRVGYQVEKDKKVRVCRKCGKEI
ncbi:MAG TPA: 50S ribosomal protein L24 [Candidatus Saccharimonadales bacterium]|nr:50S ribosomal protein L24 [Candidatus Saccharimonadales bacterium]